MFKSFLLKELRQYSVQIILLTILNVLFYFVLLINLASSGDSVNMLTLLKKFTLIFAVITGFTMASLLISSEYHAKTQYFLETLPFSRFKMILTKYLVGVVVLMATLGIPLLITYISLLINDNFDVFGDGSVVIISASGHSMGEQQVLYIDLPKTGPILLSADLYILREARDNYWISNGNDKKKTIQSFAKIDRFLDRTKTTLWIQHNYEQFKKMKLSPQFYD